MFSRLRDTIKSIREAEKYKSGKYSFNEIMKKVSGSSSYLELDYYSEYLSKHKYKYPLIQMEFAKEFIDKKYNEIEVETLINS